MTAFASSMLTNIQGAVASGTVDSGNPVKVGGIYHLIAPTLTDGQRGDLQLMSDGSLKVFPRSLTAAQDTVQVQQVPGTQLTAIAWNYDGFNNPISAYSPAGNAAWMLSASTINTKTILFQNSTTLSSLANSADLDVSRFAAVQFAINVTAVSGAGTVAVTINTKGADGVYYPLWTSTALTTAAKLVVSLGRGLPVAPTFGTGQSTGNSYGVDLGNTLQLTYAFTGTSVTFSYSLIAKM